MIMMAQPLRIGIRWFLKLAIVVGTSSCLLSSESHSGTLFKTEGHQIFLGCIEPGSYQVKAFRVRNTSADTVTFEKPKTSCSCQSAEMNLLQLEANASTSVRVQIKAPSVEGPIGGSIVLKASDDSGLIQEELLNWTALVSRDKKILILPRNLNVAIDKISGIGNFSFSLLGPGDTFKSLRLVADDSSVSIRELPSIDQGGYVERKFIGRISSNVATDFKNNVAGKNVIFESLSGERLSFPLLCTLLALPNYVPQKLSFGVLEFGQSVVKGVRVRRGLTVEPDVDDLTIVKTDLKADSSDFEEYQLNFRSPKEGKYSNALRIRSQDGSLVGTIECTAFVEKR